jgi:hypothetical protein
VGSLSNLEHPRVNTSLQRSYLFAALALLLMGCQGASIRPPCTPYPDGNRVACD